MKIGLRTVKTGIAVGITMLVSRIFNIDHPFFAMVAALIAMQPTVSDSWHTGANRMLGTFIGALVGVIFIMISPPNFIMISLGIILLIHIMNRLGWNEAISIASVVFIAIYLNYKDGYTTYALSRLFDTFIGISIALIVNYLIYPPTYDKKLLQEVNQVLEDIWIDVFNSFNILIGENVKPEAVKKTFDLIEEELDRSEKLLKLQAKEESVKVYGYVHHKDMEARVKLTKEIYQHLQNLLGVLEKGIKKEVVDFIIDDFLEVREYLNEYTKYMLDSNNKGDKKPNLQPAIDLIRQAKTKYKFNPKVNEFPSDEVIRLLVAIYNLEEILFKFNFVKSI